MRSLAGLAAWSALLVCVATAWGQDDDERMAWWREARFGLFIHWGLYAIPAGEAGDSKDHGEWIMTTAQIPVEEYEKYAAQFNPVKFDADAWAKMAADAGMKYVVITSKHHDGFCLFDSQHTDYDVMSTPFQRDILKELSEACRRHGLKMCWYHSIMDWHHTDYLPRRDWEKRSAEGADFDRYVAYMRAQVTELLTNYGPIGVMWFDGEWENTWSHDYGQALYDLCRKLQQNVIVNNRVDVGRAGMEGFTQGRGKFAGDFGTPEQTIPARGIPGVDWESCMTMNRHWGYNRADKEYKSTRELLRMLVDIASKGGNFLLNVGPTAEGEFPPESVERLREIGAWMKVNGEAIHGTRASPLGALEWGRCTQKRTSAAETRLYLHVFDWPTDGRLLLPKMYNEARRAYLLAGDPSKPLRVTDSPNGWIIEVPMEAPDRHVSVVVLDVAGKPDLYEGPVIEAAADIFVDSVELRVSTQRENADIHYTTNGTDPTLASAKVSGPVTVSDSATVKARIYREGEAVSPVVEKKVRRVSPRPAEARGGETPGLRYEYYEGEWEALPDFDKLEAKKRGAVENVVFAPREREERFAFRYRGFIEVPATGVYQFFVTSDDGSRLRIGDAVVVDNDGLHGAKEASGRVALAAGVHPIAIEYFERTGGDLLQVELEGPGVERGPLAASVLTH